MKFYGSMSDIKNAYFITELIKGEDLFTYHRLVGNFNNKQTAFYGAQILSIFEYLHSKDIVYRDLKPENIMINADGYLKLIDFGFAKHLKKCTYTICGTPEYIAPEIILNQGHGKQVDWWALGILLFELAAGYPPFEDDDPMNLYCKILNNKPRYPFGFDSRLKSLTKHLLRRDTDKRICTADDVKKHRFFDEINFEELLMKLLNPPYQPQQSYEPKECKGKRNGVSWDLLNEKEEFKK